MIVIGGGGSLLFVFCTIIALIFIHRKKKKYRRLYIEYKKRLEEKQLLERERFKKVLEEAREQGRRREQAERIVYEAMQKYGPFK